MDDNNTNQPPYRASQAPLPKLRPVYVPTYPPAWVAMLFVVTFTFASLWAGAVIKANLLAASRPERILVRIPTAVRVPGPIRVVQPACPVVPSCLESVRSLNMEAWHASEMFSCIGGGSARTTIRDHYVVVECHCPEVVHSPAAR